MNPEIVRARVKEIHAMRSDDEAAHSEEDSLRNDLLQGIADGSCEDPQECARLALETNEIPFARWCA